MKTTSQYHSNKSRSIIKPLAVLAATGLAVVMSSCCQQTQDIPPTQPIQVNIVKGK